MVTMMTKLMTIVSLIRLEEMAVDKKERVISFNLKKILIMMTSMLV